PRFVEHSVLFQPISPGPVDPKTQTDANSNEQNSSDETSEHHGNHPSNPTHEVRIETVIPSDESPVSIADAGSPAPLRILVTRQTDRDPIIVVQCLLSSMGYLTPKKFFGRLGEKTVAAIKAFVDRIEIPTDIRQRIAEKLTTGSSLIVADKAINSAVLPE